MALYIPPSRGRAKTGRPQADDEEGGSRWEVNGEWTDHHIEELFTGLSKGRYGVRLGSQQVEDLKQLINRARGADGILSPSQALYAIGQIHKHHVKLGLDRTKADAVIDLIIQGPQG